MVTQPMEAYLRKVTVVNIMPILYFDSLLLEDNMCL